MFDPVFDECKDCFCYQKNHETVGCAKARLRHAFQKMMTETPLLRLFVAHVDSWCWAFEPKEEDHHG